MNSQAPTSEAILQDRLRQSLPRVAHPMSMAEKVAMLDEVERVKLLYEIAPTAEDMERLLYTWDFWARPNQKEPESPWQTWAIFSGRGFGKTRTGAEACIKRARHGPFYPIALIGQTKGDVRDTMVEVFESSIMRISSPQFMPRLETSKRRLTWPNGMIAIMYSGDEPSQLRGPQHGFGWVDELCLVSGTKIATDKGQVPIEQVKAGDKVWTRSGLRRVLVSQKTREAAPVMELTTSSGNTLTGTANHPIFTVNRGFVPLGEIGSSDILLVCQNNKKSSLSHGAANAGIQQSKDTTPTATANSCIEPSTARHMAQFPTATTSITRMKTRATTPPITLRRCRVLTISSATGQKDGAQEPSVSGMSMARSSKDLAHGSLTHTFASSVAKCSWQKLSKQSIAPARVRKQRSEAIQNTTTANPVQPAASLLPFTSSNPQSIALANVLPSPRKVSRPDLSQDAGAPIGCVRSVAACLTSQKYRLAPSPVAMNLSNDVQPVGVASVVPLLGQLRSVYNIEVEGDHEYFANGILTHNSKFQYPDETWANFSLGLRLGPTPQSIITTTPRPIPIIKKLFEDNRVIKTFGSTYDNASNLPATFLEEMLRRYEGTRLGGQEIHGKIMGDVEGALWGRDTLEKCRVFKLPHIVRMIIAVDPSAGATGDYASETGIIAAGIGDDGHAYILQDCTVQSNKPEVWGSEVVAAYHRYAADAVVAETNMGGEMVRYTLQTIDPNLPVIKVTASRNKQTRAEPVSALYSQGRVHHLGLLPLLEDELCSWVPGDSSPDRLDACVWAITELILKNANSMSLEQLAGLFQWV